MMNKQVTYNYQQEIDNIRECFGFDFVSLTIIESTDPSPTLTWKYASGNLNNRYKRIILYSGKGIAGNVYKTGKPMLIKDVGTEVPTNELLKYPIVVAEHLQSLGAVPLWEKDRVMGIVLVGFRTANQVTDALFEEFQQLIASGFGQFYTGEK